MPFSARAIDRLALGLTFLGAVDAPETDTFRMLVEQHFEGVAVEDGDDEAGEVGSTDNSWDEQGCQQQELCLARDHGRRKVATS